MEKELLIGEFSKRTGISKRMIRFLDEQKLLEPIHCDEQNGYRYYEENQIQKGGYLEPLLHARSRDSEGAEEVPEVFPPHVPRCL